MVGVSGIELRKKRICSILCFRSLLREMMQAAISMQPNARVVFSLSQTSQKYAGGGPCCCSSSRETLYSSFMCHMRPRSASFSSMQKVKAFLPLSLSLPLLLHHSWLCAPRLCETIHEVDGMKSHQDFMSMHG